MSLSNIKRVFLNKYVVLSIFVLLFYLISHFLGLNIVTIDEDRTKNALWFYFGMLYVSLPIITFVAFYRLIFLEKNLDNSYIVDDQILFLDVFEQDTSLAGGFCGQLLVYEKYLFLHMQRLQDKMKKTERRGIAFASSAAIFPLLTYLLVSSVALANEDYSNLSTLTVANLTLATICVSAGVTLINLSKKIGVEVSSVRTEISEIMKMRIVLGAAGTDEIDEIRKKIQLRLIKLDGSERPKQEDNVDVPTIVGLLKNLSSTK